MEQPPPPPPLSSSESEGSSSQEFPSELQSQSKRILQSNDNSPMETLFSHLLNPNGNPLQRTQALTFFQCCKKHHTSLLLIKLFFLLRWSPNPATRDSAARTILLLKPSDLFLCLEPQPMAHLKAHLLQYLSEETSLHVLRLAATITGETIAVIHQWPQLFTFILSSLPSPSSSSTNGDNDDRFREVALLILKSFPKECSFLLSDHKVSIHGSLLMSMCSTNPDVQVASFGAAVTLVRLFSDPSMFHELLRGMMVGVFAMLHGYEESHFPKAFKELIKLASDEPSMLRPYMSDMILDVLQIAESGELKKKTHCLAFELVMAMVELKECESVLVKLNHNVLVRLFMVPMKMLVVEEEDNNNKGGDDEETLVESKENGGGDVFKFGMKCLNQLCVTIGGCKVVPVAQHVLQLCFDSPEWKMRHAGITMLTVIAKKFSDEMVLSENFVGEVVAKVLNLFQDSQVQVRLAAFNFMEMPSNFVHAVQLLYHQRLVHAFAIAIDSDQNDKVKEQAASTMLFFLKNTLPESLTLYKNADALMGKLLSLAQGKENAKQRSIALSAFNIVAQRCREIGRRHSGTYLPILLEACNDKNSEIKEEAIRGIRISAEFGTQQFKLFVNKILSDLSVLMRYPQSVTENVKAHDIAVSALGRICEFHRDSIDGSRIVPTWLSLLPLKADLTEAKLMHEQLALMVSRLDKDLLGAGNQNLVKIIEVFLEVIDKGDKLATPQTVMQMSNLLRQFGRLLPRNAFDTILLSLNTRQRELLLPLVS